MHQEALNWLCSIAPLTRDGVLPEVIEFGSRAYNGTARDAIPHSSWHGIDLVEGPCVDEVADAALWMPPRPVDCVVCVEVFEHTPHWRGMLQRAADALIPGGCLVMTCATDPRKPHGADGEDLKSGEHYENVDPGALMFWLESYASFPKYRMEVARDRGDLYLIAWRA